MLRKKVTSRIVMACALTALLLFSACTVMITPEAGGGEATAVPQEEATTEATEEATEEPSEEASDGSAELIGPTWQWIQTEYGDGSLLVAADPTRYTLTFHDDGTVSAQLDCNSGSGTYAVDGASITFGPMASTLMACMGESQVDQFATDLSNVNSHVFQDGHLFLAIKLDSGIMEFAPAGSSEDMTSEDATPEATEEPNEEASDSSGQLVGTTWQWVQSIYEGDMIVASTDPTRYTITFLEDGTFEAQLDCNRGFGSYTLDGSGMTIGPIGSTRMACPADSLDSTFIEDLEAVESFAFADGNLHLTLSTDGVMELAPAP
jgi:heat shock protein HslJ